MVSGAASRFQTIDGIIESADRYLRSSTLHAEFLCGDSQTIFGLIKEDLVAGDIDRYEGLKS